MSSYSEAQVTLVMTAVGTNILYYDLTWDQGTNGVTYTSYTVTALNTVTVTGLTSGQIYKFKFRN